MTPLARTSSLAPVVASPLAPVVASLLMVWVP